MALALQCHICGGKHMLPNAERIIGTKENPRLERYRLVLGQAALFRGCSTATLDDLLRRMQIRTRQAGMLVVAQDEPGDTMFVVAQGRVKVALFGENGREVTLAELRPGEFFGEMALFDSRPRAANVV